MLLNANSLPLTCNLQATDTINIQVGINDAAVVTRFHRTGSELRERLISRWATLYIATCTYRMRRRLNCVH